MNAIYYIKYSHPNGDYWESPKMSLEDMEELAGQKPITEEIFISTMKDLFQTKKSTRESNIQIIKIDDNCEIIIYEQKVF